MCVYVCVCVSRSLKEEAPVTCVFVSRCPEHAKRANSVAQCS